MIIKIVELQRSPNNVLLPVLHGLDLESEHCMFQNRNGKVTLLPLGGAQCSVNGVQVTAPTQLNQGEKIQSVTMCWMPLLCVLIRFKHILNM